MQKIKRLVTIAGLAALMSAASPVWAESAPVFDVDSYDAGGAEPQDQDLPMPPAPGDDGMAAAAPQSSQPPTSVGVGSSGAVTSGVAPSPRIAPPADTVDSASAGTRTTSPADSIDTVSPSANTAPPSSGVSVSTENLSPEERMHRLEQQITNLQSSGSASQVESLQAEVQTLRGQIEQMTHELDKVRSQQKTASVGSTAKIDAVTDASAEDAPVAAKTTASTKKITPKKPPHVSETDELGKTTTADVSKDQPNVAEEQKIYQTAYDFIKAKKYNEAVTALQAMLKKYPSGQFASNAHYWLGELYGLMSKNDNALEEFKTVITKFPGSPRVSDAELKVGLILAAQSKWSEAKNAFKKVINTYPGTASSRLASEQLKQIKLAGH